MTTALLSDAFAHHIWATERLMPHHPTIGSRGRMK
jgi:hypothetical protein